VGDPLRKAVQRGDFHRRLVADGGTVAGIVRFRAKLRRRNLLRPILLPETNLSAAAMV
jgi:hypothetical protein